MKRVEASSSEESIKALYAGYMMSQDILSNSSIDIKMHMKAILLVGDQKEYHLENVVKAEFSFFSYQFFLKFVVYLMA